MLLAVLSVYAMVERREAFRPAAAAGAPAGGGGGRQRPRLLVSASTRRRSTPSSPSPARGACRSSPRCCQSGAYGRLAARSRRRGATRCGSPSPPASTRTSTASPAGGSTLPTGSRPAPSCGFSPTGISFPQWGTLGRAPSTPRIYAARGRGAMGDPAAAGRTRRRGGLARLRSRHAFRQRQREQ